MKNKVITVLLTLTFLICGMASAKAANSPVKESPQALRGYLDLDKNFTARKYVIGPNDVLDISIYDSPEFDQKGVVVQPDGKITINPLGSFYVAGLTLEDLQNTISNKLNFYLNDPQVSITLAQSRSFIVYISGAVMNPGSYELSTSSNERRLLSSDKPEVQIDRKTPLLTNVLIAAGGIAFDADIEHIQVSNKLDNNKYEVNLLKLVEDGDPSQDIYLIAGDTVNVPKLASPFLVSPEKYKKYAGATFSPKYITVKVFGYVNSPGLVKLDAAQSLNLNSAITAAGGYMRDSAYAPTKVYLSRADTSGKLVTKVFNPMKNDVTIMPNDTIYVPEKFRPLGGKFFDFLNRIAQPGYYFTETMKRWD